MTVPDVIDLQPATQRISTAQIWKVVDAARAIGLRPHDLLPVLASLLLLRSVQEEDRERAAIAEFDGTKYDSRLPREASWEVLTSKSATERANYFFNKTIPAIQRAKTTSENPLRFLEEAVSPQPPKVTDQLFAHLTDIVSKFDLTDTASRNSAAQLFEHLIDQAAKSEPQYLGEYTTPAFVRSLMIEIAAPELGDRVYDPCFGSGGLLVAAAKRMIEHVRGDTDIEWSKIRDDSIFGIERNAKFCLIAAVRLLLIGVPHPRLERGDSLERGAYEHRSTSGFDCVLANPPFGQRVERNLSSQYRIASSAGHNLFLQHILASLRPGGRAVVLVPETLLFASGPDEALRKLMLTEYRIDEVISLAAGALLPQTSVKSNVLVVRKLPPRRTVWLPGDSYTGYLTADKQKSRVAQMFTVTAKARAGAADRKAVKIETARIQAAPDFDETPESDKLTSQLAAIAEVFATESTEGDEFDSSKTDTLSSVIPVPVLSVNDWQLVAKRFEPSSVDAFVENFASAFPKTQVVPLSDCAEVFLGMRYRTTTRSQSDLHGVAGQRMKTVRVRDLTDVEYGAGEELPVFNAENPIVIEADVGIPPVNALLIEGDILLSVGGTIGRVAVVESGHEDSVASSALVVIRCREGITSEYLGKLLRTRPYQDWLSTHATGTSIPYLSVRTVRRLKIPIPSLADQRALIPKLKRGADERTILSAGLPRQRMDWLETLVRERSAGELAAFSAGNTDRATLAAVLRRTLKSLRPWRNALVHDLKSDPVARELSNWYRSAEDLDNVLGLERSTERWGALQSWLNHFTRWQNQASGVVLPLIASAAYGSGKTHILQGWEKLVGSLQGIAHTELRDLAASTKLTCSADPPLLTIGRDTEVTLSVRNEGALLLRKVSFETQPFVSSSVCAALSPQEAHRWVLKIRARESAKIELNIMWSAVNFEGEPLSGVLNLALEVQTLRESARPVALGESPYIVGNPIDETKPNMFFGREAMVKEITRSLRSEGPSSVILLEGNRRSGKSSLLLHLRTGILPSLWTPVYCNFQKFEGHPEKPGVPTAKIFYGIAKELVLAGATLRPTLELPGAGRVPIDGGRLAIGEFFMQRLRPLFESENPFERFQLTVEAVLDPTGSQRFLLMLDEFDKIQEGIENGITSPQVPENIRNLFHTYNRISGILTGSRTIRRLRNEYWNALFGLGKTIVIKGLDETSARRLVVEPVTGRLVYAPLAVETIVSQCARQPFLIQGLCDAVFELSAHSGTNLVTVEMVEEAAAGFAGDSGHFRHVWDHIPTDRQRLLACLVDELTEGSLPITSELVRLTLQDRGIEHPESDESRDTLQEDLDELVYSEILGMRVADRVQTFHIEIPLFSQWLRKNVDAKELEAAVRNLDRV